MHREVWEVMKFSKQVFVQAGVPASFQKLKNSDKIVRTGDFFFTEVPI